MCYGELVWSYDNVVYSTYEPLGRAIITSDIYFDPPTPTISIAKSLSRMRAHKIEKSLSLPS